MEILPLSHNQSFFWSMLQVSYSITLYFSKALFFPVELAHITVPVTMCLYRFEWPINLEVKKGKAKKAGDKPERNEIIARVVLRMEI
jgi:hypothetical protein